MTTVKPSCKILILGTGRFAAAVLSLAAESGNYDAEGFVESLSRDNCRNILADRPILWIDDVSHLAASHQVICALGTTRRSEIIQQAYACGFRFATLVHPSAQLPCESTIAEGSILSPGCIVGAYTDIGRHVLINRGCLIGHHAKISDFCTVSPGANIGGSVTVGEKSYIGMGAIVLDHINIGAGCVVGAGAVVTHDLPDHVQATGIPAKITKEDIQEL